MLVGIICFAAGSLFGFSVMACLAVAKKADESSEKEWEGKR